MTQPLVIYHDQCLDGLTAAWIVSKSLPHAEFVPMMYGMPFDVERARGREVIFADFCFKKPEMEKLLEIAREVEVLDHHATAKDTLDQLAGHPKLDVFFDIKKSGAGVAWDTLNVLQSRPELVNMVEFNDTHAPQDVPDETRRVIEFFRAHDPTFESVEKMFRYMADPFTRSTVEQVGATLVKRKSLHVEDLVRNAHLVQLNVPDGRTFTVWATNCNYFLNSETGAALTKKPLPGGELPPFGLTYNFEGKHWKVSLRSSDAQEDVRIIAQAFGGGGHRNASGFECQKLPWEA